MWAVVLFVYFDYSRHQVKIFKLLILLFIIKLHARGNVFKMKRFKVGKDVRLKILMWMEKNRTSFYLACNYSYTLYFLVKIKEVKGYLRYKTIFCYLVLKISGFLWICEICRSQNLWRHHRHCFVMEVIITLTSLEC